MSKIAIDKLTHSQKVRFLYKSILRLHKGLPPNLQELGNKYARDEFRRHKQCSPMEAEVFMTEWAKYAANLQSQMGMRGKPKAVVGEELDSKILETLSDDQVVQLYELMLAAKGLTGDTITPEDLKK